jgi:Putative amidoligase enzyme
MSCFNHSFGVEIECFLPADTTRQELAAAINQRLNDANACQVQEYNHNLATCWKIVTDGSLQDYSRGIEIVSPILKGEADLAKVEIVCKALTDFGCTVNKKCGLHVHVGVGNASLRFWKDLLSMYNLFEPVIDNMMPKSRRASNNNFCNTMRHVSLAQIESATSFSTLLGIVNNRTYREARYYKLNMTAYARHRTVEFRQHSGTTDANKVKHWVLICLSLVEAAKQEQFNAAAFGARATNAARVGTKNHMIGQMLLRPEGVTSREALAVTGWTSISIPEIAGFCGISIHSRKMGRLTRYYAVTAISVQANLASLASLIKLSDATRSYMEQRSNDLAGDVAWAA